MQPQSKDGASLSSFIATRAAGTDGEKRLLWPAASGALRVRSSLGLDFKDFKLRCQERLQKLMQMSESSLN